MFSVSFNTCQMFSMSNQIIINRIDKEYINNNDSIITDDSLEIIDNISYKPEQVVLLKYDISLVDIPLAEALSRCHPSLIKERKPFTYY